MTVNSENEYKDFVVFRKKLSEDPFAICKKAVLASLLHEDCPYECEVDILLTDDGRMRSINREQRNIDMSTDVLSFPLIEFEAPSRFDGLDKIRELFDPDSGNLMLGDIVLSADRVMHQAKEYGHSCDRELAFLTVHSMLHLLGYDHIAEEERLVMEERQRKILLLAGYAR